MALDLRAREVVIAGRRLSLLVPRSADDLLDDVMEAGATEPPYWADLWPSAQGLAAHLLERDDLEGRRVLELGCGVGLPSIAALLAGADVLATDYERVAVRLAARNARRCVGRRLATLVVDIRTPPDELLELAPFELVMAADVLYVPGLVAAMGELLPQLVTTGGEVVIAYPFAGQAAPLVAGLGWEAEETPRRVPGWHGQLSTVTLLRLRPG